jgi:hypothetical protein
MQPRRSRAGWQVDKYHTGQLLDVQTLCLVIFEDSRDRTFGIKSRIKCQLYVREQQARFEELVLPHLDAAYRLARLLVKRHEDAQDVVQDAYIKALKGFERFRGGNARAWILMIVRNTAYNWLKKHHADSDLIPFDEAVHQPQTEESVLQR